MISKYLKDLGISKKSLPWHWCKITDKRQIKWFFQRCKYGFDSRETWSLNRTFYYLMYPRLAMYNEVNCVDTVNTHTFEFQNNTYTFQECIDKILDGWKLYLTTDGGNGRLSDEQARIVDEANQLFILILPALWW